MPMSFLAPHLRSPSRSSHLPAELAQIHLNISQSLLKEAELLSDAEALEQKCYQGELQHRSILDQIGVSFDHPSFSPSRLSFSRCSSFDNSVFVESPIFKMASLPQPVMVPVGGDRELPKECIPVIKNIWSKVGYEGSAYTGMQKEIDKELVRADFARFERQMLCKEILALRQDNESIRYQLDESRQRTIHMQAGEERIFRALLEREMANPATEKSQGEAKARDKEVERPVMTPHPSLRPLNLTPGPRMPISGGISGTSSGLWPGPGPTSYYSFPYPHQFTPSLAPSPSPAPPANFQTRWTPEELATLRRTIPARNPAAEDRKSLQDHLNARMDRDQLVSLPSESRPTSSLPSHVDHQQQSRKKVVWHEPLIGSSSAPGKRYYNNP